MKISPIVLAVIFAIALSNNSASAQLNIKRGSYPNCLYCKHKDELSYFSYSYSYCKARDKCVADQWNYIN